MTFVNQNRRFETEKSTEGALVYCVQQAKKLQRKNFSHSEARLREIKRENKMMVDRLAHVAPSQPQTPLPPAPV